MDYIIEFFGETLYRVAEERAKEFISKKSLQKLLLGIMKEDKEAKVDNILRKEIMNISSEKIKPNLFEEQLKENLDNIFEMAFPDSTYRNQHSNNVVKKYKKNAMKEFLGLYHLEENIEEILKNLDKTNQSTQKIHSRIDNVEEHVGKIDKKMDKMPKFVEKAIKEGKTGQLLFINELNQSRAYFYLIMELCTNLYRYDDDLEDDLDYILGNSIKGEYGNFEYAIDNDEGFCKLYIDFEGAILQCDLKEFLKRLNDELYKKDIQIVSISTN